MATNQMRECARLCFKRVLFVFKPAQDERQSFSTSCTLQTTRTHKKQHGRTRMHFYTHMCIMQSISPPTVVGRYENLKPTNEFQTLLAGERGAQSRRSHGKHPAPRHELRRGGGGGEQASHRGGPVAHTSLRRSGGVASWLYFWSDV